MSKSRKDEHSNSSIPIDVEQQFILRLPEAAAENLRKDLQSGSSSLKEKLSMEIHPELRKGKVVYDGQMYNAKLFDLPCIVESYKTTDRKAFYKTADVSQILICSTDFVEDVVPEEESGKKKDKDKKFNWMHGLCAPFKNVRKRRFRKIIPKKNQEQPDMDRELKRLFATDIQAIEVKYEVIEEEEEPRHVSSSNHVKNKSGSTTRVDSVETSKKQLPHKTSFDDIHLDKSPSSHNDDALPLADGGIDENHMDIFGDVSSSEDGEEGIADRSMTQEGEEPNDNNNTEQLEQNFEESSPL